MEINWTLLIATYGALLSTGSLSWNIFNELSNKGKLDVLCYLGQMAIDGQIDQRDHLAYKITNKGRKPIVIGSIGGETKEKGFFIPFPLGEKLPKELKPGEFALFTSCSPDTFEMLNDNLEYLCAYDTLGKRYKANKKEFKNVINSVKSKRNERIASN